MSLTPDTTASATIAPGQEDNYTSWLIGVVMAFTIARLTALFLSPLELGFDEAQYWVWAQQLEFGYFTKPPLIAWAIAATTSVCGHGQACVRAISPLAHAITALLLFATAAKLYGRKPAFWTAVFYLIIPGIAISSLLITTDALLLMFWSLGLLALVSYRQDPKLKWAMWFGLAVGLGLNAKYAMIYLPLLAIPATLFDARLRAVIKAGHVLLALAIAAALIAPNVIWNMNNGFATVTHTGENIGWALSRLNYKDGFEFLFSQFGVAGPIVFGAMITSLLMGRKTTRPENDRLLKWLSWPVILLITIQGFLAQANANWGATAFPAGVVLVAALLLDPANRIWFRLNLIINGSVCVAVLAFTLLGVPETKAGWNKPLRQLTGWQQTADNVLEIAEREGAERLVVFGRGMTASMIYATRNSDIKVLALALSNRSFDQFQLKRPWRDGDNRENTLVIGIYKELAERLKAHEVAVIDAPLFSLPDEKLTVYSLEP